MPDTAKRHVFISHSSADKPFVRSLALLLKERGIPVWLDEEELIPGANWRDAITRAIRDASAIILVLSESSVRSSWQNIELGMAWSLTVQQSPHQHHIIPIVLTAHDAAPEVPAFLQSLQSLRSDTTNVAEVAESVADAIEGN